MPPPLCPPLLPPPLEPPEGRLTLLEPPIERLGIERTDDDELELCLGVKVLLGRV